VRSFNVLLVDDDHAQLDAVEDLSGELPGLDIKYASTQDQALEAIEGGHLQLAIVDVSLRRDAEPDTDGITVLKVLRKARPSCERVLLTSIQNEDRREAIRALAPARGEPALANGLVDKLDEHLRARQLIAERAARWLHAPVEIRNADVMAGQLSDRGVRGPEVTPRRGPLTVTESEVQYVLSRLFGQGEADPERSVDLVDEVTMNPISEGWSRSVVAWCEPRASKSGRIGPRCVVKIGPRPDAEQEVQRYRSYVRFGVPLRYRVELLDYVRGDTVGAVCYSYGSARDIPTRSVQQLFWEEDDTAIRSLELLFDVREKYLLADVTKADDLVKFFRDEYGRDTNGLIREVRRFIDRSRLNISGDGRTAGLGGCTLDIPKPDDFAFGSFSGRYAACVVHGDLHGGNILVAEDGQPVLIDYRNMTRGPRLLDFASLEASLRMLPNLITRPLSQMGSEHVLEVRLWRCFWQDEALPALPYWAKASLAVRRLMLANFPDCTELEYAATALLRALRVFAASAVQDEHRARLLVWISVLVGRLRQLTGAPVGGGRHAS